MPDPFLQPPPNLIAKLLQKSLSPIRRFMTLEAASGIALIVVTIIAMFWANSSLRNSYEQLFATTIVFQVGNFILEHSLLHWINDGLMVIFFFVVGLEIKRELLIGELSSPKKAALPIFAAIGGMVVPALIYHFWNVDGVGKNGWGIPMATDIAFAVGVLTLLGKRVPFALRVFLLALAIVDDLGAVLVIAIFYTDQISLSALAFAAGGIAFCLLMSRAGIRNLLVYLVAGIFIWLAFMKSGVHATISGVILGFITPIKAWFSKDIFVSHIRQLGDKAQEHLKDILTTDHKTPLPSVAVHTMTEIHFLTKESISPLDRLIHTLHPWVMFFIMPLFALANAGVYLGNVALSELLHNPITIGTFLGLLIGKPIGIVLLCWLAVRAKLASLPLGVTWNQIWGVGILGGIGFTMALFVSHLALKSPEIEAFAKMGILSASLCASLIGYALLLFSHRKNS